MEASMGKIYEDEYLPFRSGYLKKNNSNDDLNPDENSFRDTYYDNEYGNQHKSLNSIYN